VACAVPAARLDAADRHTQRSPGGDEHGHVEGAVLLRAEHFLALVHQNRDIERVVHHEVVDLGA
jgi:hypothetical protein